MPVPVAAFGLGSLGSFLATAFAKVLGFFTRQVVTSLGIGFVAYLGVTSIVDFGQSYINARFSELGALGTVGVFAVDALNIMNVPEAFGIIFSAVVAKLTLQASRPRFKPTDFVSQGL